MQPGGCNRAAPAGCIGSVTAYRSMAAPLKGKPMVVPSDWPSVRKAPFIVGRDQVGQGPFE